VPAASVPLPPPRAAAARGLVDEDASWFEQLLAAAQLRIGEAYERRGLGPQDFAAAASWSGPWKNAHEGTACENTARYEHIVGESS